MAPRDTATGTAVPTSAQAGANASAAAGGSTNSSFWTDNTLEPKRTYRWVGYVNLFSGDVDGSGKDFGPKPFLVKSFTKPKMTFNNERLINNFTSENEILTNHYVWEDATIVMIDIENEGHNASSAVYNWLKSLGYEPEQTIENLSKLFSLLQDNKFEIKLSQIDNSGKTIETWTFIGPQPTSISFGDTLDYATDDLLYVTLNFAYLSARYEEGMGET